MLRDVSLDLERGDALAIMGPSGSGKSTLLHILGTLDRPTRGEVRLEGRDPFALSERQLADFRNRHIGFVFQDHHLLPQCSVMENVLIPTLVARDNRQAMKTWARQLLDRVGLSDRLDHRPAELSGGERQRVAVARALIHRPVLLLADEPTGNLDRRTAESVGKLLLELHREEHTILIVVTHSMELADLFPRMLVMEDGSLQTPYPPGYRHPLAAKIGPVNTWIAAMTLKRLRLRNLLYHWRGNVAVFLGVVVGTAVLTGACSSAIRYAAACANERCSDWTGLRKRSSHRVSFGRRWPTKCLAAAPPSASAP